MEIPPAHAERVLAEVRGAEAVLLPEAVHSAFVTTPDEVWGPVRSFILRHATPVVATSGD